MYEILYYLTLPFVILSASMASFYVLYPEESKKQLMGMSWKLTKFMVECNEVIDKLNNKFKSSDENSGYDSDSETDDEDNEYDEVIIYNHNTKRSLSFDIEHFYEKTDFLNNDNIKLILFHSMEDDDEKYKRIDRIEDIEILKEDEDNLEVKPIEKQFIQIEYITEDKDGNEKIVDIHSNLGDFYVKGSIILDRYFLEWYLETFYDIEIDGNYKLRFFDKDVNMFTLSTNNAIVLSDNTYTKIDIDDSTFVIKEKGYEGAEESDDDA
jgi:hypothetical protein